MAGFTKNEKAVTVTVRPDGSYYVEPERVAPRAVQIKRVGRVSASPAAPASPVAVAVTTSLKELAGIAVAARSVAPALGKYGVVAAIGLGVLNAWASTRPPPPPAVRFQLRRLRRPPK